MWLSSTKPELCLLKNYVIFRLISIIRIVCTITVNPNFCVSYTVCSIWILIFSSDHIVQYSNGHNFLNNRNIWKILSVSEGLLSPLSAICLKHFKLEAAIAAPGSERVKRWNLRKDYWKGYSQSYTMDSGSDDAPDYENGRSTLSIW